MPFGLAPDVQTNGGAGAGMSGPSFADIMKQMKKNGKLDPFALMAAWYGQDPSSGQSATPGWGPLGGAAPGAGQTPPPAAPPAQSTPTAALQLLTAPSGGTGANWRQTMMNGLR